MSLWRSVCDLERGFKTSKLAGLISGEVFAISSEVPKLRNLLSEVMELFCDVERGFKTSRNLAG